MLVLVHNLKAWKSLYKRPYVSSSKRAIFYGILKVVDNYSNKMIYLLEKNKASPNPERPEFMNTNTENSKALPLQSQKSALPGGF